MSHAIVPTACKNNELHFWAESFGLYRSPLSKYTGNERTTDIPVGLLHALTAQSLYLALQRSCGLRLGLLLGLPDLRPPLIDGSALLCDSLVPHPHRL